MSSGPKNVTSTTTSEPPSYLQPYIQGAASSAAGAFGQLNGGGATAFGGLNTPYQTSGYSRGFGGDLGGPPGGVSTYGGAGQTGTVGGASPTARTGAGLDALFNRGLQGSDSLGAANQLTQSTLQGDFLNSNPYLDQTFNRAADLTRGRLDTEFAGAGRNLGAARPARSEELQTLASNIYGGNYQAERDRQAGAVNNVGQLQSADFQNIQAMIDAGNFPLDQYINRLGGIIPGAGGVTQSTQPVFRTGLF